MSGDQQLGAIQGQISSLYVTNIPPQITEADLFAVYSSGDSSNRIQSLRIVRALDGVARYAYLNFTTPEEALDVLNTMNYKTFGEHQITLAKNIKPQALNPDANLYVSGFSTKVVNKELHDAFSEFGQVVSVAIRGHAMNEAVQKAYVQYETVEAADAALAAVQQNGLQLPGRVDKVKIARFKPRSARQQQFTNVFVRNFPINFTPDQFRALAERYGAVTSVFLPVTFAPKPGSTAPSQTGFGFANYATTDDAQKAIQALNEETVGDFKLQAFVAKDKSERRREIDDISAKFQRHAPTGGSRNNYNNGQYQPKRTNALIFKNMPAEMTLAELTTKLTPFGEIHSINKTTQPNTFLVKFTKSDMASAAHATLSKEYAISFHISSPSNSQRKPYRQYGGMRRHQRPHHRPYPRYAFQYAPYPYPHHHHPAAYQYMQPPQGGMPPGAMQQQQQPHPQRMQTRRHRQQLQQGQGQIMQQQPQQQVGLPQPTGPLTEDERQQLGSSLYYKIQSQVGGDADLTSKITGMLLELPVDDVRALVDNDHALASKIQEAHSVLGGGQ